MKVRPRTNRKRRTRHGRSRKRIKRPSKSRKMRRRPWRSRRKGKRPRKKNQTNLGRIGRDRRRVGGVWGFFWLLNVPATS